MENLSGGLTTRRRPCNGIRTCEEIRRLIKKNNRHQQVGYVNYNLLFGIGIATAHAFITIRITTSISLAELEYLRTSLF